MKRTFETEKEKARRRFHEAAALLGQTGEVLKRIPAEVREEAQEIRFRTGKPVSICTGNRTWFLTSTGALAPQVTALCPCIQPVQMQELFKVLCSYSLYSHEQEIREGYLTLRGGHRAGICGTAAVREGQILSIREISSICLRIAREKPGAADELFRRLGSTLEGGVLIAGAPSSGKTTVLRDVARQLASGNRGRYYRVAVVDERGEIGSACRGRAENDLGVSCDLLSGYPKAQGILQAVRVLSPEYILCDELGSERDVQAVEAGIFSGAAMIATVHAGNQRELSARPICRRILETGAFGSVVILAGRGEPGRIAGIYRAGDLLDEGSRAFAVGSSLHSCRTGGVA